MDTNPFSDPNFGKSIPPVSAPDNSGVGAPPAQTHTPWAGSFLPISGDADGNVSFDSNAGIIGAIKRAVTLPGDVATGKVDPLSQEAIQRSFDMATMASPLNPAVRSGDLAIPGVANAFRPGVVEPPAAEALKAAAQANYDAAKASGVHYSSPSVASMASDVQSNLEGDGILHVLAPKTHTILNALQAVPAGDSVVPFGSLDAARKAFGNAAGDFTNPTEQKAAKTAQNALDDFVSNPPDGAVVAGNAPAASQAVSDARGNYAAAMRSQTLNGIEERAELNAASANSGQNTGNAIRQRAKALLLNPKQLAGFSSDEIAALNQVVRGSATNNAARIVGNLLGGGGGMHGGLAGVMGSAIGEQLAGPIGAVAGAATPVMGAVAKHIDNAATRNSLSAADALVRQRSPLFQQMSAAAPRTFANPEWPMGMPRAAAMGELPQDDQGNYGYSQGGRSPTLSRVVRELLKKRLFT